MPEPKVSEDVLDRLAEAIMAKIDAAEPVRSFHTDETFVAWLDKHIHDKLKLWAAGLMLAYAIPLGIGIWQLSAINQQIQSAFEEQSVNTAALRARGGWIIDQEQFNCELQREILDHHPEARLGPCTFSARQNELRR